MAEVQAYFKSIDLTTWLIALGLVVLVFIIKKPLVTLVLRLAFTRLKKKDEAKYEQLRDSLSRMLGYILFISILLIALPYIRLGDPTYLFITKVLTTLLLVLAFSILYRTLMITVNWYFDAKAKKTPDKVSLTARNFLISGIRVIVIAMAAMSILSRWVGNLSGLIAGLGISS